MTFRIELFKGVEAEPYIRPLSEMRIKEFFQFPYLYAGNVEDDLVYTKQFSSSPQGMLVVAFKGETVAGIRSGMPLQEVRLRILGEGRDQQFEKQGIKASNYYYGGEVIVNSAFRRRGLGTQLMTKFIKEVKRMGFPGIIDITSIRPPDHPLRPQHYLEEGTMLLTKLGFQKSPVAFTPKYPTRQRDGTIREEENTCVCWVNTF